MEQMINDVQNPWQLLTTTLQRRQEELVNAAEVLTESINERLGES